MVMQRKMEGCRFKAELQIILGGVASYCYSPRDCVIRFKCG